MPAPRKIDLIPAELRDRLASTLSEHGFGQIVEVTEKLNVWLEEQDLEIRIGKTAVGEYSKLLKDQRDAFSMAETLLADMDIDGESDMHRVLMQMIATSAVRLIQSVRAADGDLGPKDLASLSRMLKDLMHSAGLREKLKADERTRVRQEAREEAADNAGKAAKAAGLTQETADAIKAQILGVAE